MAKNVVTKAWNITPVDGVRDSRPTVPVGQDPVWSNVPDITFVEGTANYSDISGYATDPNNDTLFYKVEGELPAGVGFSDGIFQYDGVGSSAEATVRVIASDQPFVVPGGDIAVVSVIPEATGTNIPFTIGHVFKRGEIPTGWTVTADIPEFQVDIRNRWSDGSIKFAVLSGHFNGTAGEKTPIQLSSAQVPTNQPSVITESVLISRAPEYTVRLENARDATIDTTEWSTISFTPFNYQSGLDSITSVSGVSTSNFIFGVPTWDNDTGIIEMPVKGTSAGIGSVHEIKTSYSWLDAGVPKNSSFTKALGVRAGGGYPNNISPRFVQKDFNLSDAFGLTANFSATANYTVGKIREFLGPQMSEFHYIVTRSDEPNIHVFYYVRCYKYGGIEIDISVENGWVTVPDVQEYTLDMTFLVNGVQRDKYVNQLMKHHTRYSRLDWVGTENWVRPVHDPVYLMDTKIFPNYKRGVPLNKSNFNTYHPDIDKNTALRSTPFNIGDLERDMRSPIGNGMLGVIPAPDVAYLFDPDWEQPVYKMERNSRSVGPYSIWYKHENTGTWTGPRNYGNLMIYPFNDNTSYGTPGSNLYMPAPAGDYDYPRWDNNHLTNSGWMGYYILGRWTCLDTLAQQAAMCTWVTNPSTRPLNNIQTRGVAWDMRQWGTTMAALPDTRNAMDDSFYEDVRWHFDARLDSWHSFSLSNPLGINYVSGLYYSTYWTTQTPIWYVSPWMINYALMTKFMLMDVEVPHLTVEQRAKLLEATEREMLLPIALGKRLPHSNWRYYPGTYALPIAPYENAPTSVWYSSWAQVYTILATTPETKTHTTMGLNTYTDDTPGSTSFTQTGQGTNFQVMTNSTGTHTRSFISSLAKAVDLGVPDALESWENLTSSTSYIYSSSLVCEGLNNLVIPRTRPDG